MSAPPYPDPASFPAPPAPSPSQPGTILFGRFGLRAGWGIAIFVIFAAIVIMASSLFALAASGQLHAAILARQYAKTHHGTSLASLLRFTAGFVAANDGLLFFCLFAFCWLLSRAERRPLFYYGIGQSRRRDFIPGTLWGLFIMCALALFLWSRHLLVFDGRALHGAPILSFGVFWLFAFLLVGLAEEYQFRGYLQYTLMRGFWGLAERLSPQNPYPVAFWSAAIVTSCVFAGLHINNSGENLIGLLQVVFVGLVFCYALYRTGSLWWGIGFHALWDWTQSFLLGVPDSGNISVGRLFVTHPSGKPLLSGGADGPEGSIFAAVAVLLTIFAIRLTTQPGLHPSPVQLPHPANNLPPESNPLIA